MATVIRWIFDYGGIYQYTFPRNPDRYGGDTFWNSEPRSNMVDIIGSNSPSVQIDGFRSNRTIRFTAITGTMMRTLQQFFLRKLIVSGCRDHLYPTSPEFKCFIISFVPAIHPTIGSCPGSGEDTYDLEMAIVRMS